VTSARQLARNLEVPMVNDMGYTKRYVRCLQVMNVASGVFEIYIICLPMCLDSWA
jgi:hypothetical protein